MKVILFRPSPIGRGEEFVREIEMRTSPEQLVPCDSLAHLVGEFPWFGLQKVLLVLLVETQELLLDLLAQRDLLREYRIILVLPDGEEATFTTGHELYPRFVTSLGQPPEHLGAVLTRMIEIEAATHGPSLRLSLEQHVEHGEKMRKRPRQARK